MGRSHTRASFDVILLALKSMESADRRITRTHVQKFVFLAQRWLRLEPSHQYSFYLHGPYSRELDGEIAALQSVGLLEVNPDKAGYGAAYSVSPQYLPLIARLDDGSSAVQGLHQLGSSLGKMTARELEGLSTVEWVITERGSQDPDTVVAAVRALKPHLNDHEVRKAIEDRERLKADMAPFRTE